MNQADKQFYDNKYVKRVWVELLSLIKQQGLSYSIPISVRDLASQIGLSRKIVRGVVEGLEKRNQILVKTTWYGTLIQILHDPFLGNLPDHPPPAPPPTPHVPPPADSLSPIDVLARIYNETKELYGLPAIEGHLHSQTRRHRAEQRLRENPDPEYWATIFMKASESPWIKKEIKSLFDFVLAPEKHIKIASEFYGNPFQPQGSSHSPKKQEAQKKRGLMLFSFDEDTRLDQLDDSIAFIDRNLICPDEYPEIPLTAGEIKNYKGWREYAVKLRDNLLNKESSRKVAEKKLSDHDQRMELLESQTINEVFLPF